MQLSKIGEFGLIKHFRTRCAYASPEILKGIGDDSAVIKGGKDKILITSDILLEGIHFDLSFTTFYQLGYKVLAVNISDIFAMGGNPKYFLLNLGVPKTYDSKNIHELYSGIIKIAKKFGVAVVGGDTCASRQGLVLGGALVGYADRIIMRSGAREGDSIFVTGTLGDSAMGLMILKKVRTKNWKLRTSRFQVPSSQLKLIKRHLMPEPEALKNTEGVTSMIDVSDGLLMDLSHICDESKVGAIIYRDKIPVSRELANAARELSIDPINLALRGGEDYVLLFTAPPDIRIKTKAIRIGEIIKKGRFIIDSKGKRTLFKAEGYEHFKK
jgi:thiamine-monophosphate kinase